MMILNPLQGYVWNPCCSATHVAECQPVLLIDFFPGAVVVFLHAMMAL